MYEYNAKVVKIYDGDTLTLDIDLGMFVWAHAQKIRVARINCPEVRGEEREQGLIARDYVRDKLSGGDVKIRTFKDTKGKYGRWIAEVEFLDPDTQQWTNLSDLLVRENKAVYHEY